MVEEKDLRAAADQRAGDLTAMLETAQQQLQDVERAKAAEDVVTHVAATQTYGNVVEFATQTEDVQAKEAVETCIASVQTDAMGQSDAHMGELAAAKEVLSWLENILHVGSLKGIHLLCGRGGSICEECG